MAVRHNGTRSDLRPGRIALGYLAIGLIWIYGSGFVVQTLSSGPLAGLLESVKGTGFVVVTAAALYVVLARRAAAIRSAEAARQAADAERMRLAIAVEQASESILVMGRDGLILYANPALEQAFGYSNAELLGGTPARLLADADSVAATDAIWPRAGRENTWRGGITGLAKDGRRLELDTAIGPIRNSSGELSGHIAILRDVSRERAMERELAEASRMEAVGQLAGGIAHDFNNMLTAISGYAELLADEVANNHSAKADVDEIMRASRSAAALVRQLLALARRQVLDPSGLALDELVEQLRPMLDSLLGPRMSLEVDCTEPLAPIFADAGQIEQVLVNLTVNARDAMAEGGKLLMAMSNVTVAEDDELSSRIEPGRYVRIAVTDTGSGMDQITLSRVFEPFFTTKPAGKGTGLGLATTYGIVRQSGGYLFAESEPGTGSTFTVFLPRYDGPARELPAEQKAEPTPTGDETVLVIEDDDAVRALVTQTLSRLGYRVLVCANGNEALAHSPKRTGPVPLLVTDIRLPGQDGVAVAARLKATHQGMRVLYISGYAGEAMVTSGLLAPDEAFLAKPFSADDLARRVRDLLDGSKG